MEVVARDGQRHPFQTHFREQLLGQRILERDLADAEVIALVGEGVGRPAIVVVVAPVGVVGPELGVFGLVARLLPALEHILGQRVVVGEGAVEVARVGLVEDRVARRPVEIDRQGPVFQPERVVQTAGEGRHRHAEAELVGRGDLAVAVAVGPFVVAHALGADLRKTRKRVVVGVGGLLLGLDDARGHVAVEAVERFAFGDAAEEGAVAQGDTARAVLGDAVLRKFQHAVLLVAEHQFRVPAEVLLHDIARGQFDLVAPETHLSEVGPELRVPRGVGQLLFVEQVARALVEEVGAQIDPVLEQAGLETHVELVGGLPLQPLVGHVRGLDAGVAVVHVAGSVGPVGVVDADRGVVARRTVAGAQLQEVEPAHVGEPRLLGQHPAARDAGEEAPAVVPGEFRRAVLAEGRREKVFPLVVVVQPAEEADLALGLLRRGDVVRIERRGAVERGDLVRGAAVSGHFDLFVVALLVGVAAHDRDVVLFGEGLVVGEVGLQLLALGRGLRPRRLARGVIDVGLDELLGLGIRVEERSVDVGRQAVDQLPFQPADERKVVSPVAAVVVFVVEERRLRRGVVPLDRRTVLVIGVHRGRIGQGARDGVALVGIGFGVRAREVDAEAGREPLGDLRVEIALEVHAVIPRREGHALVVGIAQAGRIAHPFAAAVDPQVVVLPPGPVVEQILPVGVAVHDGPRRIDRVGHRAVAGRQHVGLGIVVARRELVVGSVADTCRVASVQVAQRIRNARRHAEVFGHGRTDHLDVLARIEEVDLGLGVLIGPVGLEGDPRRLVVAAALGGHQDDAVRCLGAVDGRRGGILQHVDRRDVVGVDGREVALDAVDQHQRRVGAVDRRTAADLVGEAAAGREVGLRDAQAGDLALEALARAGDGDVRERLAVELGHGRGDRTPRLFAVAHDHHFVHGDPVGREHHLHLAARRRDRDLLRHVTDERHGERGSAGRHVQRELAVDIGGGTRLRTLHDDRGSDDGAARIVGDAARHAQRLLREGARSREQQPTAQQPFDYDTARRGGRSRKSRIFHLPVVFRFIMDGICWFG